MDSGGVLSRENKETMDGMKVSDASLIVYVHPSMANKLRQALLRQLSTLLFTFNEIFDGVLLAYSLRSQTKRAKILSGLIPYFGVKVEAKLLLFSPKPGMVLEGKVVKLGKESIHVIVLGFSSAAITLEDIREEFKYKIRDDGVGVFASRSHKKHVIKAGSMLRFVVKSLDEEILHISGSLIPAHTGCIRWLSKHGIEEGSQLDSGLKRQRERERETELQEHYSGALSRGDFSSNPMRHKLRKTA